MSAEPAPTPAGHIIPQGILEISIKITNEPPTGMHANLHKSLDNFSQVRLYMTHTEYEWLNSIGYQLLKTKHIIHDLIYHQIAGA